MSKSKEEPATADTQYQRVQSAVVGDYPEARILDLSRKGIVEGLDAALGNVNPSKFLNEAGKEVTRSIVYKDIAESENLDKMLRRAGRAELGGVTGRTLWCRGRAASAYTNLIEAVNGLGRSAEVEQHLVYRADDGGDLALSRSANAPLELAAWTIAHIAAVSCWTLYGWDAAGQRPFLMKYDGVISPQLMAGGHWHNSLARRLLLHDAATPCVRTCQMHRQRATTFIRRERIRESWAVPLRTHGCRAVLFLNHRDPANTPRNLEAVLRANGGAPPGWLRPRPGAPLPRSGTALEPRDLFLAVRYVIGWLSARRFQLRSPSRRLSDVTPGAVLSELLHAARGDHYPAVRSVARAARIICKSVGEVTPAEFDPAAGVLRFQLNSRQTLAAGPQPGQPKHSVERPVAAQGAYGEREGSLCGVALRQRRSVYLPDIPPPSKIKAQKPESTTAAANLLESRLSQPHPGAKVAWDTHSEVAVPVVAGATPLGAVSLELADAYGMKAPQPPSAGDDAVSGPVLYWVEVAALLAGAIAKVRASEPTGPDRAFLDTIAGSPPIGRPVAVHSRFCTWALGAFNADLCCAYAYDGRIESFRPAAVAADPDFCRAVTAVHSDFATPGLNLDSPPQLELFVHALRDLLIPRRRGLIWQVFRRGRPIFIPDVIEAARAGRIRNYLSVGFLGTLAAVPMQFHESCAPAGVLLIGWRPGNAPDAERFDSAIRPSLIRAGSLSACIAAILGLDLDGDGLHEQPQD